MIKDKVCEDKRKGIKKAAHEDWMNTGENHH